MRMKNLAMGVLVGFIFVTTLAFCSATASGEDITPLDEGDVVEMYIVCDNVQDAKTLFDFANKKDLDSLNARLNEPDFGCISIYQLGADPLMGLLNTKVTYSARYEVWSVDTSIGTVYSWFERIRVPVKSESI